MLSGVRFVARESVGVAKNGEEQPRGDADDPEMLAKRKDAGLEWMSVAQKRPAKEAAPEPQISTPEEPRVNSKELNPHLKDGGEGYPSETSVRPVTKGGVGDGGASWRLKAMKRAKEQAERDGKDFHDVVEDRWGSYDDLAAGMAGRRAAHANAHLHAIRDRKRRYVNPEAAGDEKNVDDSQRRKAESSEFGSRDRSQMKAPRVDGSFKWGRETGKKPRPEHAAVPKAAPAFKNDGSFMQKFMEMEASKTGKNAGQQDSDAHEERQNMAGSRKTEDERRGHRSRKRDDETRSRGSRQVDDERRSRAKNVEEAEVDDPTEHAETSHEEAGAPVDNQIAAKAMRLRLMGKAKEADELLAQHRQQAVEGGVSSKEHRRSGDEAVMKNITARQKHSDENRDFDSVLASKIYRNKDRFNADEEYDDVEIQTDTQKRRASKKGDTRARNATVSQYNRIQTQHERCQFCFENPSRPKHLTIAIGNFTYLMLPPTAALVPGHCYIAPTQHEGSTRNVDDDVWEEIRNFKKCLLKMFKEQEKEVIFMETVMGLSQQRRHCLVECIPVPPIVLKQAPLYFKKAIDEAEDEWSQHNAKKLIDTRVKGLRGSIPKNFPYFHVEFGLEGGYVHVIDDEASFKSNFGRNVLIGMLKLPQESMHQRSKQESFEQQRATVKQFSEQWKPHDWTTMLE